MFFFITLPTNLPREPIIPPENTFAPKRSFSSAGKTFPGGRTLEAWGQRRGLETLGLALPAWALQSWGGAVLILQPTPYHPPPYDPPQTAWEAVRPQLGKAELFSVGFPLPGAELEHREVLPTPRHQSSQTLSPPQAGPAGPEPREPGQAPSPLLCL